MMLWVTIYCGRHIASNISICVSVSRGIAACGGGSGWRGCGCGCIEMWKVVILRDMPHHEMTGGVPVLLSFVSWGGTPTPPNTFRGNAHMVVSLDIHIHTHTITLTHLTLHRGKNHGNNFWPSADDFTFQWETFSWQKVIMHTKTKHTLFCMCVHTKECIHKHTHIQKLYSINTLRM